MNHLYAYFSLSKSYSGSQNAKPRKKMDKEGEFYSLDRKEVGDREKAH